MKIEKGNQATDWTPAPEDVQSDIDTAQSTADGVRTTVTQTRTEVEALKTSTESLTTAMREYTKITDFEAYKKQVSSQLSQTPEAITARFNTIEETVSKQGEASNSKWQELENYIQFSSAGITLGKKNDPLTLVLDLLYAIGTKSGVVHEQPVIYIQCCSYNCCNNCRVTDITPRTAHTDQLRRSNGNILQRQKCLCADGITNYRD